MSPTAQALLDSGQRVTCERCGALVRPNTERCRFCGVDRRSPAGTAPRQRRRPASSALDAFPGRELVLVVPGTPESQGSMSAVAPGVVKHDKGPQLGLWRRAIIVAAEKACPHGWVPIDAPVRVSAVFTVPRRRSDPSSVAVPADGWRDLDKLQRAVGDALCPRRPAFRVLASDMRITQWHTAKTHPRPLHTELDALNTEGVVIRVSNPVPLDHDLDAPTPTGAR